MATGFVHINLETLGYTATALKRMEKDFLKHGISVVAGIASETRDIAYDTFFSKRLWQGLRYNTPDRKFPLVKRGGQGYIDSRGYRLVNFSLESKRPSRKTAYVSSYPMNLWEHKTKNGRPGLHIMSMKLAPLTQGIVPKHVALSEAKMAKRGEEILEAVSSES
jgi:hypothetical protein